MKRLIEQFQSEYYRGGNGVTPRPPMAVGKA
jgi:hypothetical protein